MSKHKMEPLRPPPGVSYVSLTQAQEDMDAGRSFLWADGTAIVNREELLKCKHKKVRIEFQPGRIGTVVVL